MLTKYKIAVCALIVTTCFSFVARAEESADTQAIAPISGSVQATFDHDEVSGTWTLHMSGNFAGEAVSVENMQLFGTDASGYALGMQQLDMSTVPTKSPFIESFQIPKPNPVWSRIGIEFKISNGHDSISVRSSSFPVVWQQPVLIDHAVNGSVVIAPNYVSGAIPPGIGIPHTLINGLPEGDYYALVFFEGVHGCPSDNYVFNSFLPHDSWYSDTRPIGEWSKGFGTTGGGCMQQFHIDPKKGGNWLWGAVSNTGTSSAIADAGGVPAFAICATAAACDPIIPHANISAPEEKSGTTTPLVSSVLFLPGIKGSGLYEDNPLCLIPSDGCGIKVWLPLADAVVPELFLDTEGKSKRTIFVRDGELLGNAFGHHFYDSFTTFLDKARVDKTFGDNWNWKGIAYDWRLSLPDIIRHGTQRGSHIYFGEIANKPYMERQLRALASSSPTGKVTIVAHSNGGLVAKALMQSLGNTFSKQLIDSVILIGVPQSGAPRALGALLYGDAEGIPGIPRVPNVIMSTVHAREFGLNSPMAYHLLPSARYMSALQPSHPVVKFQDSDLLKKERAAYGPTIDSETELYSFALAQDGGRILPATSDLNSANILNSSLFTYSQDEHSLLDAWEPPTGIKVYELGGYGADTISGIDLYQSAHRGGSVSLSYRPMFTSEGDGTVPIISALMMNASAHVHHIYLDLLAMHTGPTAYSHANLLEAVDVQETIKSLLRGSAVFPFTARAMDMAVPIVAKKKFGFFAHSPVSLSVSDASGNRTSVGDNGTEENIIGSTAGIFGDVKYVLVPTENPPYTLTIAGEGNGSFTLDLQELENDELTASSTVADVPVTGSTRATLSISSSLADASSLSVDETGDGITDFSLPVVLGSTTFPVIEHSVTTMSSTISAAVISQLLPAVKQSEPGPTQQIVASKEADSLNTALEKPMPPIRHAKTRSVLAPQEQATVPRIEVRHPTLLSRLSLALEEILHFVFSIFRTLGGLPGA